MMQKDQDIEYLEKLKSGDEEGLRYFMSLLGEQLLFYTYKITRNREVSEEIVSESFCKLWQKKENTNSVFAMKAYLYLLARNASYDHLGTYYIKNVDLGDDIILNTPELKTDILSQIIYTELIEQIVIELDNLPKQQADVFRMVYFEGKNTDEICESLGTTANTVYFARSKAISKLRQIFKEKDISFYSAFILIINLLE
ncbi:MAG: RNA polymerase sigma factor [Sphingobacterium composti]